MFARGSDVVQFAYGACRYVQNALPEKCNRLEK